MLLIAYFQVTRRLVYILFRKKMFNTKVDTTSSNQLLRKINSVIIFRSKDYTFIYKTHTILFNIPQAKYTKHIFQNSSTVHSKCNQTNKALFNNIFPTLVNKEVTLYMKKILYFWTPTICNPIDDWVLVKRMNICS